MYDNIILILAIFIFTAEDQQILIKNYTLSSESSLDSAYCCMMVELVVDSYCSLVGMVRTGTTSVAKYSSPCYNPGLLDCMLDLLKKLQRPSFSGECVKHFSKLPIQNIDKCYLRNSTNAYV